MDARRTLDLRVGNARQEEKRIQKENSRHKKIESPEEYVLCYTTGTAIVSDC